MAAGAADVFVYSLATFLGNVGVAVTGFGMAIVYLFVWQVARLCGWEADFKHAVFIQAIGLFAAQPLLLRQANIRKHGSRSLLKLFLPVTVLSTPLGQWLGIYVDEKAVQTVGGVIICLFAAFEVFRNRRLILEALRGAPPAGPRSEDAEREGPDRAAVEDDEDEPTWSTEKVFFMIGSQRSGSNWLRTMMDEREDIAGPHPPHIFDNFLPILGKFGDLGLATNREILIDHVLTFVERNQVPWTDRKGRPLTFDRGQVFRAVEREVDTDAVSGIEVLMVIFNEVYDTHARANFKRTWMCKSMGMSKYHDTLLNFYGKDRLRYIYLVRDPRDVAMSFMNTPVGDCHYHAIATKWVRLQESALKIADAYPDMVHLLRYEELLQDKAGAMERLFEFVGQEHFAMKRQQSTASVLAIRDLKTKCEDAKNGNESKKAAGLSKQFCNLTLGDEFAKGQFAKWRHGTPPMPTCDVILVENVTWDVMQRFGYMPSIVSVTQDPAAYSKSELETFEKLNREGIEKMNADLEEEDPEDANRRRSSASVLALPPELILKQVKRRNPSSACRLEQVAANGLAIEIPGGLTLRCAALSQAGDHPIKRAPNQDTFTLAEGRVGVAQHWLAVYDGHGPLGRECAAFARDHLCDGVADRLGRGAAGPLAAGAEQAEDVGAALKAAHIAVDDMLREDESINDQESGTTAISMYVSGDRCYISNVGDSCCFRGHVGPGGQLAVEPLSEAQAANRPDEADRIRSCGGVIATASQVDGTEPMEPGVEPTTEPMDDWTGDGPPPRVWAPGCPQPGCAFTRSIGDRAAKLLGVVAEPELRSHTITRADKVFVLCSDGVSQYMTAREICSMALQHDDPVAACASLVAEARQRWLSRGGRVDDITALVCLVRPDSKGEMQGARAEDAISQQEEQISPRVAAWAISMGFASGFLGGLCGIRGPPIIIFFLHMVFPKAIQKANGAAITVVNVSMRILGYAVDAATGNSTAVMDDWPLYASVVLISPVGVAIGGRLFDHTKDSQANLKTILAMLLVLCGISLLITAFE
ncbi:unnamed protein product [Prorocentrum cordatum]|uniref:PPM-type phosphatase domain-containing protein n=1 Tax=Prorocentrum cordatum TaxID=2364126 RepID=A0ABN9XQJ5_9DINO|nr:unnamed protein product [Polarella glacialis]